MTIFCLLFAARLLCDAVWSSIRLYLIDPSAACPCCNPKLGTTLKNLPCLPSMSLTVYGPAIVPPCTSFSVFSQMACANSGEPARAMVLTLFRLSTLLLGAEATNSSTVIWAGSKKGDSNAGPTIGIPVKHKVGTARSSIPNCLPRCSMRAVLGFLPSLTALAPAFFSWVRCSARISGDVERLFHSPSGRVSPC